MKELFVIALSICLFQMAEASTCFVEEASPEAAENYADRVGISTERRGSLSDVDVILPATADGYALSEVFFVVSKEESDVNEVSIPVAAREVNEETLGASFTLPISLLQRASLIVTYGRCGAEYQLKLGK
ncbi:hypothetical protein [Gilvimarinus agarilyticus]|uniref:hypothetical protein n=1 Tax=Gilvimarinus agarilyticus TaxID=679259 RepID=UPI0005A1D0BC|nr:hypothetical protein [Gilvimarinus agarilyticus]